MPEPRSPVGAQPELPIYPDVEVRVRSRRPLVWVSAVRYALWRAGIGADQIDRFTDEALSEPSPRRQRLVCTHWVTVSS